MPGFGFMEGVSRERQEEIKTSIVSYLERNRRRILFALEVLDARAFGEIVERWEKRGQVPLDVEMFQFLQELELNPIVVVNKIDLIYPEERDALLDNVCEKLGLPLPWRQWLDVVVPISAKTGEGVKTLKKLLRQRLHEIGREHLLNWLK
ncbi:MAG: hypothetical protein AVW05_02640 [Hadesarchaea archaeon DG-33]|nr:MAG: hypothetical protein AVW05_02640 [Hadesarchaea archaeon DG-33]